MDTEYNLSGVVMPDFILCVEMLDTFIIYYRRYLFELREFDIPVPVQIKHTEGDLKHPRRC